MKTIDEAYIVNYCHPNCIPLKNIFRLSKEDAFLLARKLADSNPETTAFYRFADFENYYAMRTKQDKYLYDTFLSLGGIPKETHPLSFVIQGSEYLEKWFNYGTKTVIQLKNIPSHAVSFSLGDSGAMYKRNGAITMFTKETLNSEIEKNNCSVNEYLKEIKSKYTYMEVQLWDDEYCKFAEEIG